MASVLPTGASTQAMSAVAPSGIAVERTAGRSSAVSAAMGLRRSTSHARPSVAASVRERIVLST